VNVERTPWPDDRPVKAGDTGAPLIAICLTFKVVKFNVFEEAPAEGAQKSRVDFALSIRLDGVQVEKHN